MRYSLGITSFLEEVSSLFHSVVFLCFFELIAEEAFLISTGYSLEFCRKQQLELDMEQQTDSK